jgi:hypothetical protein
LRRRASSISILYGPYKEQPLRGELRRTRDRSQFRTCTVLRSSSPPTATRSLVVPWNPVARRAVHTIATLTRLRAIDAAILGRSIDRRGLEVGSS